MAYRDGATCFRAYFATCGENPAIKPFDVSTVQEIEAAIKRLPREEFLKLHARLQRHFEDEWDQQMKADAKAGRLDHLAEEAIADYRAGGTKPFPPEEKPRHR